MCVSKIGVFCCAKQASWPQWFTSVWSAQSAGSQCIWETWPCFRNLQISGITLGKFQQYLTKPFTLLTCTLLPADINHLNTIKPRHDMLQQIGDMRTVLHWYKIEKFTNMQISYFNSSLFMTHVPSLTPSSSRERFVFPAVLMAKYLKDEDSLATHTWPAT